MAAPQLEGDALAAVTHRGSHLQIIAAAGSGKTEVVSQRVASLIAEQVPPESIVAFTFTERAATELRQRIERRVAERSGRAGLDRLGGLFVGTIHAYCFRFLQTHVPRYETYDVLDDHQLTAFLAREAKRLDLRQLDPKGQDRLFASIRAFLESVDVIENELLDPGTMPEPFRQVVLDYLATLDRYRLLTYGQQVVRAVRELERPEVAAVVHGELEHLIVDEYQDVNPAQERLVELLAASSGVELCVVGDDDQAIYQWRGSDVSNIVEFAARYPGVVRYEITTNRRSRPTIIRAANGFATSIPGRLPKQPMGEHRAASGGAEVVTWTAPDETKEAGWIANLVIDLYDAGVRYRDIAILVRGRAAYPKLVEQLSAFDVPVQPGGRTGLFEQPEAILLGRTFAWMTEIEWRQDYGQGATVVEADLLRDYRSVFGLDQAGANRVRRYLHDWRDAISGEKRTANLVGELYELLAELGVQDWDLTDRLQVNRLGTLARFTALLADYESVRRRARSDPAAGGEQVGGQDRGVWYYRNLAIHIVNYARGAYEGFDGEPDFELEAIDLTTVHRAKGLEWPAVFVCSLTDGRFPSGRAGSLHDWLVPRDRFSAARYEGGDADERRLFYVAATRARDWLSLSRHERVTTQRRRASPYHSELSAHAIEPDAIRLPAFDMPESGDDPIEITFSELSLFLDCGHAYRLRNLVGFQPRLAQELGYGKAVHHVLRTVAERTRDTGAVPTAGEIQQILDRDFFLPTANKAAHRELKGAAGRLVIAYAHDHADDLHRVWETERPFELHLDGITVSGRADVILDREGGGPDRLAILDYKTSAQEGAAHDLQLQVYADAGRREGLDVRGGYVHDLKAGARSSVDVSASAVAGSEQAVLGAAARLRARDYTPAPERSRCRRCEVRTICKAAKR